MDNDERDEIMIKRIEEMDNPHPPESKLGDLVGAIISIAIGAEILATLSKATKDLELNET